MAAANADNRRLNFEGGVGVLRSDGEHIVTRMLKGSSTSGGLALSGIKLLAIALLLAAAPKAWADLFYYRFVMFRGLYGAGYAIIFSATILALGIIPFLRNA